MKIALVSVTVDESPAFGLASIATYLQKHEVQAETRIFEYAHQDILRELRLFQPELIGISAMTIEYMRAKRLAEILRKEYPSTPLIIGGVHISTLPESLSTIFDVGVVGEAEETFLELVKLYKKHQKLDHKLLMQVNGLVFFQRGKLVRTPQRQLLDLSNLPTINYRDFVSRLHFRRKRKFIGGYGRSMAIFSSRGCPYRCVFCSTSNFWQRFRFRPEQDVVDEIRMLHEEFKVDSIGFWDDMFVVRNDRMEHIREGLKQAKVLDGISISVQSRANLVNDHHLQLLKSLNTEFVGFGFESGSDGYLKYLKGNSVTLNDNKRAVELTKKHGFVAQGSLIFGGPGETLQDMESTVRFIQFAHRHKVDFLWSFVMTPFPSTRMWEIALQRRKVSTNMNFDILSHQQIDNPLLLDPDIPLAGFRDVFLRARREMDYVKYNIIRRNVLQNPLLSFMDFASRPQYYLGMVFKHTTTYGDPLSAGIGNAYNRF